MYEARGTVEGEIAHEPRGERGFGYDPIFYYPPYDATLAEVTDEAEARGGPPRSGVPCPRRLAASGAELPTSNQLFTSYFPLCTWPKRSSPRRVLVCARTSDFARLDDHRSVESVARTFATLCADPRIALGVCHPLCRWLPGCLMEEHVGFGIEVSPRVDAGAIVRPVTDDATRHYHKDRSYDDPHQRSAPPAQGCLGLGQTRI